MHPFLLIFLLTLLSYDNEIDSIENTHVEGEVLVKIQSFQVFIFFECPIKKSIANCGPILLIFFVQLKSSMKMLLWNLVYMFLWGFLLLHYWVLLAHIIVLQGAKCKTREAIINYSRNVWHGGSNSSWDFGTTWRWWCWWYDLMLHLFMATSCHSI